MMDVTFWCRCGGMASGRTCPHTDADRLQVSGTQLRKCGYYAALAQEEKV